MEFSNGEVVGLTTDVNGMITHSVPFNPGYYSVTATVNESYVSVNEAKLDNIEINKIFFERGTYIMGYICNGDYYFILCF